ncbi:MAG: hypothetical protein J5529_03080 [Prevotella sp.]|nr:hypothetical protein [Prevotella sp.]
MGNTEEALLKIINEGDSICNNKEQLESFESAINEFNTLVNLGYAKSRGYSLQTIEEFYTLQK